MTALANVISLDPNGLMRPSVMSAGGIAPVGGAASLDEYLPHLNLDHVIELAQNTYFVTGLVHSCVLFAVGGAFHFLRGILKGGTWRAAFGPVLVRLVVFICLLGFFRPLVVNTISSVVSITTSSSPRLYGEARQVFKKRRQALLAYHAKHYTSLLSTFSADGMSASLLWGVTFFSQAAVDGLVFMLKAIQVFMLAIIVIYGPFMLGMGFLGGIFEMLPLAWFWVLVEVSAWKITLDALLLAMGTMNMTIPDDFNLYFEIIIAWTLIVAFASVPVLTTALIRGSGLSTIGPTALFASSKAVSSRLTGIAKSVAKLGAKLKS